MVTRVTSACIGPPFRTLGATTLRSADVPCRIGVRWPRKDGRWDGHPRRARCPGIGVTAYRQTEPRLSARSPDDRLSAGPAFRNDPRASTTIPRVHAESAGKRERGDATPFDDLNPLLVELVVGAKEVLGDSFCGAYLQGSFAVGDADAHSDVDFIVVTKDDVTPEQQAELQALHQTLYALPTSWAQHLEGSYIPRKVLRRPDPDRRPLLYLDNGATEFALDNHDNTAVVRWSLREHGVVLAGPDPRQLVDPIAADTLRAEVRWALGHWQAWWFRSIDSISRRALAVAVLSHA